MTGTSTELDAAIEAADEAYRSIREYVEGIDEEDMRREHRVGTWSGKDLVAHLAVWEREGARILQDLAAGNPERWLPEGIGGDEYNEQSVCELGDISLDAAMDFWAGSHEALLGAYRAARLDREDILMGVTRDHYRLHYPDFRHVKPFQQLGDEDRAALIEEMDAAQQGLVELIDSIPEDRLREPNTIGVWSGQDLIAHLGHWLEAAARLTRDLENDRPGKWPGEDGSNINEWNEEQVQAMREQTLDEARAYQQRAYDELRDLISHSPYATRSAGIGATSFHYGLHDEDFRSLQ